ncbi:hypothetical protein QCA50_002549 [Cerrena zonata]|uniref:Uncharacterized protein n=1 Tax=Cerrena zonata TaxID=2478898 RepID=A0AAW0GTM5_9APHY
MRYTEATTYFLGSDLDDENIRDFVLPEDGQYPEWAKERQALCIEKKQWAEQCEAWQERRVIDKRKTQQAAKNRRLAAVIAKLKDLGWEEDVENLSSHIPHPLFELKQVNQTSSLTERAWLGMKAAVISFMEQRKTERLSRQYYELLRKRYDAFRVWATDFSRLLFNPFLPCRDRDIVSFSPIKALMDSPSDVTITPESFEPFEDDIAASIAEFQQQKKTTLRNWIESEMGLQLSTSVDFFDLAVVSLIDHEDWDLQLDTVPFDRIDDTDAESLDVHAQDRYDAYMDIVLNRCRWSTSTLKTPWSAIKYVIEATGEDPASVTTTTMDRKDTRWYSPVFRPAYIRPIMTWRAAINYINNESRYCDYSCDDFRRIIPVVNQAEGCFGAGWSSVEYTSISHWRMRYPMKVAFCG